jgi:hypothetical protein
MRSSVMHYENGTQVDVIEFASMYDLSFNRGNIIKYVVRAGKKDDEVKDLEKALDYLQREIATVRARRDAETEKIKNQEVIIKYVNG